LRGQDLNLRPLGFCVDGGQHSEFPGAVFAPAPIRAGRQSRVMVGYFLPCRAACPKSSTCPTRGSVKRGNSQSPSSIANETGPGPALPSPWLRIGEGLMLIPNRTAFGFFANPSRPCWRHRQLSPADLLENLPEATAKRLRSPLILNLRGANAERRGASVN